MMLSGIEYRSSRTEEPFQELNKKSVALKRILARIPEEISDRKTFLETIKWVFRSNFFDISPLPSFRNWNIFQLMLKFHLCFETKNHKNTSTKNAHFIDKQLWWARMKNLKHLIDEILLLQKLYLMIVFLLIIEFLLFFFREIASAIKKLLDAVNEVSAYIPGTSGKQALDQKKREFVKYSKRFSNTLKEFFRDGQ